MQNPMIVHVTRDAQTGVTTLSQPGGLTVDVTRFQVREHTELRQALRFAHTVAFIRPEVVLWLKHVEGMQAAQ